MDWFLNPIQNHYADFEGRASRQEFWMYILVYVGTYIAIAIVGDVLHTRLLTTLFSLALFVPNIAIGSRRLHDIGKSGWWQLIGIIPFVGWIIMIVWLASEGAKGANEYGAPVVATGTAPVQTVTPSPTAPPPHPVDTEPTS